MTEQQVNTKSVSSISLEMKPGQAAPKTALLESSQGPWALISIARGFVGHLGDSLNYIVYKEAIERLRRPMEQARVDLEHRLQELLKQIPSEDDRWAGCQIIEYLNELWQHEVNLALEMAAESRPRIDNTGCSLEESLEESLEDVFAQLGIHTPADADEWIESSLGSLAEKVHKALPGYPADWYKREA